MEVVRLDANCQGEPDLSAIPEEIAPFERELFAEIVSTDLTPAQKKRVVTPSRTYPRQDSLLAVHWHPEFVPMDLALQRVAAMFPNAREKLIIPTQHNEILTLGDYAGVEVDCYSHGFNRKVQLLLHFRADRVERGHVLSSMLAHTFKYRSSQLFQFMDALVRPADEDIRQAAAGETGATADMVRFASLYTAKLQELLDLNWTATPAQMIKNKLVRNFFDGLRQRYGDRYIGRVQVYLKAVKQLIKQNFSLKFFYRASEVIEEARSLGAGVVIPHPEQFWPILLAEYDVDGIEVWNPQSREYTEFLINVVNRHNRSLAGGARPMLVFMGDDCHMGEKVKDPAMQDAAKASREVGYQPVWDDMGIRKSLILGGMHRARVITEYRSRLDG
ncbi:MAG: hypothetical protein H0S85_01675 [Desulfovibrionaceae bacterium]|nr:hypothetical protein [Desulfovibrionaceae bacterium]